MEHSVRLGKLDENFWTFLYADLKVRKSSYMTIIAALQKFSTPEKNV